jgi:hypothetical protein
MFLLRSVALVDEAHVHCGHHVRCKAEHGLLSTVLYIKTLGSSNNQITTEICEKCTVTEIDQHQLEVITKSIISHTHNSTIAK